MKLPSPYICDECGTQKKESNHWWVLTLRGRSYNGSEFVNAFVLLPWEEPDAMGVRAHLCSESCATKALSKWMASLQNPAPGPAHGGSSGLAPGQFHGHVPSVQSANAGKPQPANDSPEERQKQLIEEISQTRGIL